VSVKFDYLGKLGTNCPLPIGKWKRVPKSRWKPPRSGATLEPTNYVNLHYSISSSATSSGRAWIRMMRESPNDDTLNYFLWLPKGHSFVLDERCPGHKWWDHSDLGRYVHMEIMVTGVKSAYLNDSSYVAYDQKW
jgi:hypothetical protein